MRGRQGPSSVSVVGVLVILAGPVCRAVGSRTGLDNTLEHGNSQLYRSGRSLHLLPFAGSIAGAVGAPVTPPIGFAPPTTAAPTGSNEDAGGTPLPTPGSPASPPPSTTARRSDISQQLPPGLVPRSTADGQAPATADIRPARPQATASSAATRSTSAWPFPISGGIVLSSFVPIASYGSATQASDVDTIPSVTESTSALAQAGMVAAPGAITATSATAVPQTQAASPLSLMSAAPRHVAAGHQASRSTSRNGGPTRAPAGRPAATAPHARKHSAAAKPGAHGAKPPATAASRTAAGTQQKVWRLVKP